MVARRYVKIINTSSNTNIADFVTKPLDKTLFIKIQNLPETKKILNSVILQRKSEGVLTWYDLVCVKTLSFTTYEHFGYKNKVFPKLDTVLLLGSSFLNVAFVV